MVRMRSLLAGLIFGVVLCTTQVALAQNLTAKLQQSIMDNSLKETFKAFVEGRGRQRLLKPVPFSEYKTMDQWLAAAPARFRAYNELSEKAFLRINSMNWPKETVDTVQAMFVEIYDFSGKLEKDPKLGQLHAVWSHHEELIRVFPERLFAIRKIKPDVLKKTHCQTTVKTWLNTKPPYADAPYAQAAKVYLECHQ